MNKNLFKRVILYNVIFALFVSPSYAKNKSIVPYISEHTCSCISKIINQDSCKYIRSATKDVHSLNIKITNSKTFNSFILKNLANYYIQRLPDIFGISEAKNALTKLYICSGYINSGALLESYDDEAKTVKFKIIEGVLDLKKSKVIITNSQLQKNHTYLSESFIKKYLNPKFKNFNSKSLRSKLEFLRRKPQIKVLKATILPTDKLGQAILDIEAIESPRLSGYLSLSNSHNPSIGSINLQLSGIYNSLFLDDSVLKFSLGLSEGVRDYSIAYTFNTLNPYFSWNIEQGRATSIIIDSKFSSLDITSKSNYLSFLSKYHYKQSYDIEGNIKNTNPKGVSEEIDFINGIKVSKTKKTLLGRPFSFSLGEKNGVSSLSKVFTGIEWSRQSRDQAQKLYTGIDIGIDAFGSSINKGGVPDSKYVLLKGQYSYQKKIQPLNSSMKFHINGQYTKDRLLSSEKLTLGGFNNVRGYRQGTAIIDKGLTSSLELHIPLDYHKALFSDKQPGDGKINIIPFIDYGVGSNNGKGNKKITLSSLGIGMNWNPGKHIKAEIYWAKALSNTSLSKGNDHDIQDDGLHFQLTTSLPW